jgi:hypothetical protein
MAPVSKNVCSDFSEPSPFFPKQIIKNGTITIQHIIEHMAKLSLFKSLTQS